MELNPNLNPPVKKARPKKEVKPQQTLGEAWLKIFSMTTTSPTDRQRLKEVQQAIEDGEIGVGTDNMNKFSRSHALRLYLQLAESRKSKTIQDMIDNKPSNYHLVTTITQLEVLCKYLFCEEELAIDVESTGLSYDVDHIVGISLTLPKSDYHCYIPIRHNVIDQQLPSDTVWARLKPVLEDESVYKYFFNYKFDAHMLLNEGIRVKGLRMDGSVAIRLLSEDEPSYALKNLATKYGKHFGFEDKSMTYEELFGKGGFENTPLDIGTVYACKDTHLTYKFCKWIDEQFDRLPKLKELYYTMELPITEILLQIEINGFHMDMQYAQEYTEKLSKELEIKEKQLKEMFGDINLNSSQQLASLLYDEWKLEDKSKKRSTDKATLKELAQIDHRVKLLTEYKKMFTLYNNFFLKLPEMVYKSDGKLHGNFNGIGTVTGRMSATNPNLQQIPGDARPMFVADKGKILVGADFSGCEPRILAHMSKDKDLQEPFIKGIDLYSTLASKIFNKPYEECRDGSKYRKMMKLGVLATMYGTSDFTLAEQLGITLEEASKMIEDFYTMYPKMAEWIESNKHEADTKGFLETMFGRKRRFHGHKEVAVIYHHYKKEAEKIVGHEIKGSLWKENALKHYKYKKLKEGYSSVYGKYNRVARQSTNFRIQGSAADIMKLGMIAVDKYIKTKGDSWCILAIVHDEVILEIPDTATKEEIQMIADRMVGAVTLDVPLTSDVEVMRSWGKGVKLEQWFTQKGELQND